MLNFLHNYHRIIILLILIVITLFSWLYTLILAGTGMYMFSWKLLNFIFLFLMWFFMMIAMMLPSAFPVILMFDKISKERKKFNYEYVQTLNFILSYLIVWGIFSLFITFIHLIMQNYTLLNSSSMSVGKNIGGIIFIFAGIYQMTPYKDVCVHYCRNPVDLLSNSKISSNIEAFITGVRHGLFCVGCCWVLMLVLFYVGVMNIFWIAGLTIYVLVEKYLIKNRKLDFFAGLILIMWGCKIIFY